MRIRNLGNVCELRSENPFENKSLVTACARSYSPRMCGLMENHDQMVILNETEAEEFTAGVLRDEAVTSTDKWSICKLVACWLSGEIKDEASTLPY